MLPTPLSRVGGSSLAFPPQLPLSCGQTGVSEGRTSAFREVARQTPPTAPPGRHRLGARASRPHLVPLAAAELQYDAAGSHPVGGNSIGQAEGEPWRRSRLIQVGEMSEAVPGLGAGGTPALPGSHHRAGGTPALPGSHHPMTSSPQGHQIAEAFWCRLSLKQVHLSSGLFVFICVHWWFVFINDRLFFLE